MNVNATKDNVLLLPGSVGELFDKLTILRIKNQRITEASKLANVGHEMALLEQVVASLDLSTSAHELINQLHTVNEQLWQTEDDIRGCERARDFSQKFIALARSVYIINDQRASLKRQLNELSGSAVIEEKSYANYQ